MTKENNTSLSILCTEVTGLIMFVEIKWLKQLLFPLFKRSIVKKVNIHVILVVKKWLSV